MGPSKHPSNLVINQMADLKSCSIAKELHWGRTIHATVIESGNSSSIYIINALINMYSKCDSMVDACNMFDSIKKPHVISWTALLMGYAEHGKGDVALEMFFRMKATGCVPDSMTYVVALKACTSMALQGQKKIWLELGRKIHVEIGYLLDLYVQSALIDMYAKCGSIVDARGIFDSMQELDLVSWNAMIMGYADNGEGRAALSLFSKMKTAGFTPNYVTYLAVFSACGHLGALALGQKFHSEVPEFKYQVVTCLIDFYAKCGSMVEAHEVFDMHPQVRCVPIWNALLTGYSSFGDSNSVFILFQTMQDQGFQPDSSTFVSVLFSCSHAGLIVKAREYYETMLTQYRIIPTVKHYTCMVDALGRRNLLNEAIGMIRNMPCNPDAIIWITLLGACHKWKNVEVGREAFQALVDMNEIVPAYTVIAGGKH